MSLTRGNPAGRLALINHLDPNRGSYTAISPAHGAETALLGQMIYVPGDRSARISFLAPCDGLDQSGLAEVLDSLAIQAGSWGAYHLLAEVEESSDVLEPVRKCGFSIYGRQSIWQFNAALHAARSLEWQAINPGGENAMRSLYQLLVPPLVQAAEPFAPSHQCLFYRQDDELLAYAEISSGSQGIFIQPVVHPAAKDIDALLAGLLTKIQPSNSRPIFLSVRSYQAWLETPLHRLGGLASPQQALLVKHIAQRVPLLARQPAREAYNPDATVPLAQHSTIYKN